MSQIRSVTSDFAVAPQLEPSALRAVAEAGFKVVINNRPDGEAPDQPTGAQMRDAALAAGMSYHEIPIRGAASPSQVAATAAILANAEGPVLAYCRSGTRSITAWALAQAEAGETQSALAAALNAGYDLRGMIG